MLPLLPSVTVQREPSQLRLPLSPVVRSHVLSPLQSALHEPAHVPVHVLFARQENEQLPPAASQPVASDPTHVQVASASHVHFASAHGHPSPGQVDEAGALPSPHAPTWRQSTEIMRPP